jgi:hypothetical protein
MLCGHAVPFSETWPTSGMTRGGRLYPLRTQEHRTDANASSSSPGLLPTPRPQTGGGGAAADPAGRLRGPENPGGFSPNLMTVVSELLPTPNATDSQGGPRALPEKRTSRGPDHGPRLRDVAPLLKTPTAQLAVNGGSQHPDKRREGGHGPTLADQVEHQLLPTPMTSYSQRSAEDWREGRPAGDGATRERIGDLEIVATRLLPTPAARDWKSGQSNIMDRNARPLSEVVEMTLLPTPAAHDSGNTPENHLRKKPGRSQVTSLQIIVDYGLLSSGGHMPSPSADGSMPPDATPPRQLSLDELDSD